MDGDIFVHVTEVLRAGHRGIQPAQRLAAAHAAACAGNGKETPKLAIGKNHRSDDHDSSLRFHDVSPHGRNWAVFSNLGHCFLLNSQLRVRVHAKRDASKRPLMPAARHH